MPGWLSQAPAVLEGMTGMGPREGKSTASVGSGAAGRTARPWLHPPLADTRSVPPQEALYLPESHPGSLQGQRPRLRARGAGGQHPSSLLQFWPLPGQTRLGPGEHFGQGPPRRVSCPVCPLLWNTFARPSLKGGL